VISLAQEFGAGRSDTSGLLDRRRSALTILNADVRHRGAASEWPLALEGKQL